MAEEKKEKKENKKESTLLEHYKKILEWLNYHLEKLIYLVSQPQQQTQ